MNSKNYHQKKRFGQHWLVNKKILEKIKEIAVLNENDFILEIGPGKGALTSKLLDSEIKKLHAIELNCFPSSLKQIIILLLDLRLFKLKVFNSLMTSSGILFLY